MIVLGVKVLIHLAPEHLAGTLIIGIVETIRIAATYPVVNIIIGTLYIHPALGIEFLVVIRVAIELRPYRDHEASMHLVNLIKHLLGIGIARSLELVRTPLILRPVVPVLHDIVDRNVALAELSQRAFNFIGSLIALAALPEAQHPLGIEAGLSCQRAIAGNHLIEILACNEIIVHILGHLTPYRELLALCLVTRLSHTQTAVSLTTIRTPLYAQLHALALLQLCSKLIAIGVPSCAPTLGHNFLTINIHLHIA